ncbi:MAG: hypothetical protein CVV63_01310 [Tenericutes bacterium HGW-Tenericutes-8]|nr:MAG: hypothetical protein CVV63_01310 [Tenericutes bacterium HGW-Tenericutes-8]
MPNYDIAGIKVKIESDYIHHFEALFKPYLTALKHTYTIHQTHVSEIKALTDTPIMQAGNRYFFKKDGLNILQVHHQSGQVKFQISHDDNHLNQHILFVEALNQTKQDMVYILLSMAFMEIALKAGFLPLHASSLLNQDEVILFSAPSKTGKSTHVNYYLNTFPHMQNLNDDKPLIKDGFVYGTPFSGKNMLNLNAKHKLKAVVFIHQGDTNTIHKLDEDKAINQILKNMLRPSDETTWDHLIPIINQLLKQPLYEAYLKNEQQSIYITYQGIYQEDTMKLKAGFTLKEIGSKTMVIPVGEKALNFNGVMTLNNSGKLLFEALKTEQTIESLKALLMAQYDVAEDVALKDVITFIETLKEKDVL